MNTNRQSVADSSTTTGDRAQDIALHQTPDCHKINSTYLPVIATNEHQLCHRPLRRHSIDCALPDILYSLTSRLDSLPHIATPQYTTQTRHSQSLKLAWRCDGEFEVMVDLVKGDLKGSTHDGTKMLLLLGCGRDGSAGRLAVDYSEDECRTWTTVP